MKLTESQNRNLNLLREYGTVVADEDGGNSAPGFNQTALASLWKLGLVDRTTVSVERPWRRRRWHKHVDADRIPMRTHTIHTYTLKS